MIKYAPHFRISTYLSCFGTVRYLLHASNELLRTVRITTAFCSNAAVTRTGTVPSYEMSPIMSVRYAFCAYCTEFSSLVRIHYSSNDKPCFSTWHAHRGGITGDTCVPRYRTVRYSCVPYIKKRIKPYSLR